MWTERQKFLRDIAAFTGLVAFLVIFLTSPLAEKASLASLRLVYDNAASVVSIGASMAPNDYNTLAQELEKRADELSERERELALREAALNSGSILPSSNTERLLYLMGGTILLLLLLILVNFYLDWRRGRVTSDTENTRDTNTVAHDVPHASHEGELTTRL